MHRKARIFLSCGQRPDELRTALNIREALSAFEVYIAASLKTAFENPSDIVRELKNSDYFLLVNVCRTDPAIRGSLYCHQELAIAYSLGMPIRVVSQTGAIKDGLIHYLMINTEDFDDLADSRGAV
jgi:hypothetical protein